MGVYLGTSPRHARSVLLVLSLTAGLCSPQFHVSHDDFFETTRTLQHLDTSSKWQSLSGLTQAISSAPLPATTPTSEGDLLVFTPPSEGEPTVNPPATEGDLAQPSQQEDPVSDAISAPLPTIPLLATPHDPPAPVLLPPVQAPLRSPAPVPPPSH